MSNPSLASETPSAKQSFALRSLLRKHPTTVRRAIVFVFCMTAAYAVWVAIRWSLLPGSDQRLWALPTWAKALLLVGMTLAWFGLFRLGGFFLRDARALYRQSTYMRSSNVSVRWYRYLNPIGLFYNLYVQRDLLRQSVKRDVLQRYQGSVLGVAWSLVTPLFMLAIYTFVFSTIFRARFTSSGSENPVTFGLTLFSGLLVFNLFSECVSRAPGLITSHPNFVKKVVYPLEILPVMALGSAFINAAISLFVLLVALLVFTGSIAPTVVLTPLMVLPLIGLSLGLSWFLASLGVFLRDLGHIVRVILQMTFFLSAVLYPISRIPEDLQPLIRLNPLVGIIENIRRVVMFNQVPDWAAWLAVSIMSIVVTLLGYAWFMKTKAGFADVI